MHSAITLAAAAALLSAVPVVFGHGYVVEPAAVWKQGYPSNGYGQTVDQNIFGAMDNAKYGYGPEGTLKYYQDNFPKSKYKSLKDLILGTQIVLTEYQSDAECGLTTKDEAKRATLPATIKYSGFTHPGPCEVWCDNNKLAYADDCQTTYKDGSVPIDTSKCSGADRLTVYWIGVHGAPWQVYTDCVYLKGGSGGSPAVSPAPAGNTTTKPATPAATNAPATPAATTKPATPAATKTPAKTESPVAAEATLKPATSSPKPAAPSPSTNCKRRSRQ